MKIINRYVFKEHVGPFVFALSALTSLLLLQYIARKFGDLVGRGLSWSVISEFMILSIPFTLAMTLPMAMLVSVLYAFTRLASENEITAIKAGGISTRSLMIPSIAAASVLAVFMLWFNDQVLPRANHELQALQTAILKTKPTFALRPQVLNTVKEAQLYLRAGQIDENTGLMRDVTIYDVSDNNRRRTIYSESAMLTMMPNMRDLSLHLYKGWMLSTPTSAHGQLSRIYYKESVRRVADVVGSFQSIDADSVSKGDREMSVCEMQRAFEGASAAVNRARYDSLLAVWRLEDAQGKHRPQPKPDPIQKAGGIGGLYCSMIQKYFHVQELHAEVVPRQDTTKRKPAAAPAPVARPNQPVQATPPHPDSLFVLVDGKQMKVAWGKIPPNAYFPGGQPAGEQAKKDAAAASAYHGPLPVAVPGAAAPGGPPVSTVTAGPVIPPAGAASTSPAGVAATSANLELSNAHLMLEEARYKRNRADVEIQKKFSLAFACIVFVLVGAPLALRFPRGGVGLVIGASFLIFAIYYIGLIGGESLSNKNIISPFWAMWADNIIFLIAGLVLMSRMGREGVTGRGSSMAEFMDGLRRRFTRRGHVSVGSPSPHES